MNAQNGYDHGLLKTSSMYQWTIFHWFLSAQVKYFLIIDAFSLYGQGTLRE